MQYRVLDEFRRLFDGTQYRHRRSNLGDAVAVQFYEDLVQIERSEKLVRRVDLRTRVVNIANLRIGVRARRGDGTFGEIIPGEEAVTEPGYRVARGPVATVEIGVEVKILAKAMIKQIDRVMSDLEKQIAHFKKGGGDPLCVAIVGINHADYTVSYEGERAYRTDGRHNRHPVQEAREAESRLIEEVAPRFDEFIVLKYRATNEPPFPFEWVNYQETTRVYGSSLVRISREYERRF